MTTQGYLIKLQNELVGRYVSTPLSYWKDHSTSPKDTADTMLIGKITALQRVKGSIVGIVMHEEKPGIAKSWTTMPLKDIKKVLRPPEFVYDGPPEMFDAICAQDETVDEIADRASDSEPYTVLPPPDDIEEPRTS